MLNKGRITNAAKAVAEVEGWQWNGKDEDWRHFARSMAEAILKADSIYIQEKNIKTLGRFTRGFLEERFGTSTGGDLATLLESLLTTQQPTEQK